MLRFMGSRRVAYDLATEQQDNGKIWLHTYAWKTEGRSKDFEKRSLRLG